MGQPARPYSPKNNTKHPLLLSEVHSFDDTTADAAVSSDPIVETPTTAGGATGGSGLGDPFFSRMERLHIEELPPTPPTTGQGSTEDFEQMVVEPPEAFDNTPPKPRPRNLDLLANKRSHLYVFQGSSNSYEQK